MRTFTVYKHTSPNGKVYIGITEQKLNRRWRDGEGYSHQSYFYRAIQKYGWENITHEVIADGLTKEEACTLEQFLIWRFNSTNPEKGYNMSIGGECGALGIKHSEIFRENKRLEMYRRGWKGEKHPLYGKHMTEETRLKMSEAQTGAKNHFYGKHHSKETIQKIMESRKSLAVLQFTKSGDFIAEYTSIHEAERITGIHRQSISPCCKNKPRYKTAGGYIWRFKNG